MAQPDIIRISDQFKAQLDAREASAFASMSDAYIQIEKRLLADYELLLRDIAEKGVSPGRMVQLQRYKDMMRQLFAEQEKYAQFVTQIISNEQSAAIDLALKEAYALTDASVNAKTPGIAAELMTRWNQVPFDALEAMVGFAGDGSPLMPAMVRRFGSLAPDVSQALKQGVALGWHPTKTVRSLRGILDSGLLGNALTWARTETIRASREASRRSYEANPHIIKGWTRHSARSTRTCPACIALDGKFYPANADGSMPAMDDHPQGRCSMLPETMSYSDILGFDVPEGAVGPYDVGELQTGKQYIESLPAAQQRAYFEKHLGKGAYDAWTSGKYTWEDIPKLNESTEWGNSWTVKSGKDLWGTGKPQASAWRASMSLDDAQSWAKDSKLNQPFFHGTGLTERGIETPEDELRARIESIKQGGFKISEKANGRMLGDGVYLTPEASRAQRYGTVIETRINVKNPYTTDYISWSKQYAKIGREMKSAGLTLSPIERIGWWADKNGYDAIFVTSGLPQIVVFDPKNIVVIK